jgi:CRISPR-associated exonuclease Cas4
MYSKDDLLPLSGLQHMAFCERQWALIHVEQTWLENVDTIRGLFFHECVDTKGYSCANGIKAERKYRLVSMELGIYGVADIVEFGNTGDPVSICPVEYKVGHPKIQDWDRVQLAAQAMCLEEMYQTEIDHGSLFYGETRHRDSINIDSELKSRVKDLSKRMHALFDKKITPWPPKEARCNRCSIKDYCLPEAFEKDARNYWGEFGILL